MRTKNLFAAASALILTLGGSPSSAELIKGLSWEGRFDFQGTSADNVTDFATAPNTATPATINRDKVGSMQARLLVSLGFDVLDDVHTRVTARKNNRVYGNASEDLNDVQDNVFLDEAYIGVEKLLGSIDMTLGRQFVGDPGDLVAYFGPRNDYGLTVTALDAVRVDWTGERFNAWGLAGKLSANNGTLAPAQDADTDVRLLAVSSKGSERGQLTAYLWNAMTRHYAGGVGLPPTVLVAGGRNGRLYVAGLKGRIAAGVAWANAEAAMNFGDQRELETATVAGSRRYTGWGGLVGAGAKIPAGAATLAPWGQFGFGSGDADMKRKDNSGFQTIATDYRPGALYGRFWTGAGAAVFGSAAALNAAVDEPANGLTNRVIWGGGLKATPAAAPSLTVGASVWDFSHHRATSFGPTPAQNGGNKHIGTEYDLEAVWTPTDHVTLALTGAYFEPGSVIKNAANALAGGGQGVSPATMVAFDTRIKWGSR